MAVERLSLEAAPRHSLLACAAVHRYELAATLLRGSAVADVCCGAGHGARILRTTCAPVTGIDGDVGTVDMANATVGREHDVGFAAADALPFLRQDLVGRFEAIVMFEALERLSDPEAALGELGRHAASGLKLVVSVPSGRGLQQDDRSQLADFGHREAAGAFRDFPDVALLYQYVAEGSLIRDGRERTLAPEVTLVERGEPEEANTLIVTVNLGSDPLGGRDDARMPLWIAPLHSRYIRSLEHANQDLRRTNARLARQRLGIADAAAASLIRRDADDASAAAAVRREDPQEKAERDAWVTSLELEIARQRQLVLDMEATRVWRLARRYWSLKRRVRRLLRRR